MAVTAATTVEEILRLEAVGLATNYLENYITKQLACVAGRASNVRACGTAASRAAPPAPMPANGGRCGVFRSERLIALRGSTGRAQGRRARGRAQARVPQSAAHPGSSSSSSFVAPSLGRVGPRLMDW